mmetsp:Transcript_42095/g.76977  ORF Transcript_42095/g.76977 Transcript_42095/m.76977 type:complete len:85 (+) Transcript_42095:175-429(+)
MDRRKQYCQGDPCRHRRRRIITRGVAPKAFHREMADKVVMDIHVPHCVPLTGGELQAFMTGEEEEGKEGRGGEEGGGREEGDDG